MDTNVFIAGLYSRNGSSYQILRMAVAGELDFALTPLLVLEYEGKAADKIRSGFLKLSLDECQAVITAMIENAIIVERPFLLSPILADLSDDKVVECAVSGGCEIVVTFNKRHFPISVLKQFDLSAITPGEFLQRMVHSK